MTRSKRRLVLPAAALALAAIVLTAATARAERRPPYGMDSVLLEAQVRESIERRITPLLEQMAPGQAELKYVDVRVTRPTALPAGASPGFEEIGARRRVRRGEGRGRADAGREAARRRSARTSRT